MEPMTRRRGVSPEVELRYLLSFVGKNDIDGLMSEHFSAMLSTFDNYAG